MKSRFRLASLSIILLIIGGLFLPSRAKLFSSLWPTGSKQDAAVQPNGDTVGIPWTGENGVTETVDEIMVRSRIVDEKVIPLEEIQLRPVREENEVERDNLPQNPDSPSVAQWPPDLPNTGTLLDLPQT